jgi:nitrogen fixation protein
MSDIIDINVGETIEEVTINVVDNLITVNINKVTGGGGGTQTLAETLVLGNTTGGENISISNGDAIILDNGSMLKKGTIDAGNGGAKGISQICGVGYEHKWEAGRLYIMNDGGTTIREVSHNFTITPTATDDVTKGFVQNTRWILDNGDVYVCTDPTEDAAVWELVNTIPTLQQVTDAGNETTTSIKASQLVTQTNGSAKSMTLSSNNVQSERTAEWQDKEYTGIADITDIPDTSTLVPYTGATADVDLGEYELKAGQIELDTTPTGTAGVAVTRWNDTIGTSETTLKGGSVILKNGVDLVARVVNKVTPNTTLTKAAYQVVKISGAQGQRLAVNLAQANNDNNSADTLGIVTETIATNQEGFIITVGQLENINTTGSLQSETWTDGDVLYLSPTTAGAITNVKPNGSTGHIVVLGYVEYAHSVNGKIYVKIMNGWELDELHNVYISSVANNQGLVYETSTDLWKNKTIDKTFVGLGNVDNTSDANKPVSTATQTALNLRQRKLFNLTPQVTHTGTVTKTIIATYFIPANTFTAGDFLNFSALVTKVANIGSTTHTLEINTANTLTGATIISTAGFNTTNFSMKFKREIALNGGNIYLLNISNNTQNDQTIGAVPNAMSVFTYNLGADLYLFVTCQLTNATDSITYRGIQITD